MELKEMTDEELLELYRGMPLLTNAVHNHAIDLLSAGREAIQKVKELEVALSNQMQCVDELKWFLNNSQAKIAELEKENENLKCCGNCVDSVDSLEGTLCDFWKQTIYCGGYERCWQSDNMTREEREHELTKLREP
jgi:hypothetical protein